MKTKIFAANWKLNKTPAESKSFFETLLTKVNADFFKSRQMIFFPQNFSLDVTSQVLKSSKIGFGPQNIYFEKSGAFTGENSAEVAKKMNCQYILLGHSERRQFFSETHEALSKKIKAVQDLDLTAVFCIGETLTQREEGKSGLICAEQLTEGLKLADKKKHLIMFSMGVPLLMFILLTAGLGIAMGMYGKPVYVPHMICAGLSVTLAIAHAVVGIVWFFPF